MICSAYLVAFENFSISNLAFFPMIVSGSSFVGVEVSNESISVKIQKLLTLADGNKNEHERDAAMRLAMELLSKYNLDLDEVESHAARSDVIEVAINLKLDPWVRSVLRAACDLYYTDFFMRAELRGYFYDRKEYHPTFIGTKENIDVTIQVAFWLLESIRLESNFLYRDNFERRSFRLGAAHRLQVRTYFLKEQEAKGEKLAQSTSLILLRNKLEKANAEYIAKLGLGAFHSKGSRADNSAYEMGEAFGDSINLNSRSKAKAITMR